MFDLPVELILAIVAYLPIGSLESLRCVCRRWKDFVDLQENVIWHQAAIRHQFIPSTDTPLDGLNELYSGYSLKGVKSWRDLCLRRHFIDQSWAGKAPSVVTPHPATGTSVHRIKVDEKAGYILTTSYEGGLTVTDLDTDQVLWSLPDVRRYAHCEYGEGFLIFDYNDGTKEVWRRSDDYNEVEAGSRVTDTLPNSRQMRAFEAASSSITSSSTRGHFLPWGSLRPPGPTRAFRFFYPILGVAAWNNILLWDVRTGELVQTIRNVQQGLSAVPDYPLGDINYIEVGTHHVFVCGVHALRGFSRGTGKCVLDVPSSQAPFGDWNFSISSNRPTRTTPGSALITQEVVSRPIHRPQEGVQSIDMFIAVHVSSCGSHLAALLLSSKLVIVKNFERAAKENIPIHNLSVEVQLGSPRFSSRYLAFEHGRIAAATRTGVYIVEPDWTEPHGEHSEEPPKLSILRVPTLGNRSCLGAISCLQMTETGLFLNWDPNSNEASGSEDHEELFYRSVGDEPRYATLNNNGGLLILVDHNEPDPEPDLSTVFSIDFVPR